jgi:putative MATE family efflux protein
VKKYTVSASPTNLRPLLRLAIPALAEEFLVLMVTWTDWWLAGHFFAADGDATKTAMGLMAYVMWLIPSLFATVAIGATALIARWTGAEDYVSANRAANQAYLVGICLAAALTLATWVFGEQFIRVMQLTGDSADFALEYLLIITPLIPLIMCSQVGAACLRGAGDTVTGFIAKLVVVIINILVSTMLVTGWGPMAALGWKGIAIGTATGYAVGGSLILIVLIFGRAGLKLRLKWMTPEWFVLGKLFRIGLPAGFDIGTLLTSQLIFLALINSLGKASAAAHGLAVQIEACTFLPGAAFQVAAATMAGQFLGAKLPQRAVDSVKACTAIGMTIMCIGGVVLYFGGLQIAYFFTGDYSDPTTIQTAALLRIVAFAMPCLAVVMIVSGAFRGAGDTVWPLLFTTIGFFGLRIPLAIWLAFETFSIPGTGLKIDCLGWGIEGAWYAMVADLAVRSLLIGTRFFRGGWKNVKI